MEFAAEFLYAINAARATSGASCVRMQRRKTRERKQRRRSSSAAAVSHHVIKQ
jgi:hypothetical protein